MAIQCPSTYPTPITFNDGKAFISLTSQFGITKATFSNIYSRESTANAVKQLLDLAKMKQRELEEAHFADPTCIGVHGKYY